MAKKQKNNAGDFRDKKFDLGNGLVIGLKLTVGGLLYLQDKFGKPMNEIKFDARDLKTIFSLLTALAIGSNPDMPEDEVERKIKAVDMDKLNDFLAKMPEILPGGGEADTGNPTKKRVKGNLQEKTD